MKSTWPCWYKESSWTQTHKKETVKQEEDDHVKIEAKTEVTPQTKEYLGSPETGQGKKGPSPRGFRGSRALPAPWLWISILKNCKQYISVGLGHSVCSALLCQPWETDILTNNKIDTKHFKETSLHLWLLHISDHQHSNCLVISATLL